MSEKLSPMQKAAKVATDHLCGAFEAGDREWLEADEALGRMDDTAREVMAAFATPVWIDGGPHDGRGLNTLLSDECPGIARIAYDAAEALERERQRRMRLPEDAS